MKPKHQRAIYLSIGGAFIILATYLVVSAFEDTLTFYYTPSQIMEKHFPPQTRIRLGGLVVKGSVQKSKSLTVQFQVTDGNETIDVSYSGLLPNLFKEGKGAVMEGWIDEINGKNVFQAQTVLAKHDETYRPPQGITSRQLSQKGGTS